MLSEPTTVHISVNPAISDTVIVPRSHAKAPYKLPSAKNPPAPPSLRSPQSSNAEYGYRWNDESILRYRLMIEGEPTQRFTDNEIQAMRELSRDYLQRIQSLHTIPQEDYWRRQDAYESFSFARYLLLWRIFPINDLPPEILTHIFRFVALSANSSGEAVNSRLRLTWVCRQWRALTIGDATLWSTVWFRLRPGSSMERSLMWLDRASQTAIDIMITALPQDWVSPSSPPDVAKVDAALVDQLLHHIAPKFDHLRTLIVGLESPMCDWAFKIIYDALAQGVRSTQLEHLEVRRLGTFHTGPVHKSSAQIPLPFLGKQTLSLRHLTLDGVSTDWAQSSFDGLIRLEISCTHFKDLPHFDLELPRMLRSCPHLQDLRLGAGMGGLSLEGIEIEPVTLPELEALTFYETSPLNATCLLSMFDAPCLDSLTLSHMGSDDCIMLFSSLIGRFPMLHYLGLEELETSENDSAVNIMARWFLSMPELRYLKVTGTHENCVFNGILSDLPNLTSTLTTLGKDDPSDDAIYNRTWEAVICPKLEVLEVHEVDVGVALEFVAYRKEVGAPVQRIYASEALLGEMEKEDVMDFQEVTELWILPTGLTSADYRLLRQPNARPHPTILWA